MMRAAVVLLLPILLSPPLPAAEIRVSGPEREAAYCERRVPHLVAEAERALGFVFKGPLIVQLAAADEEFHRLTGGRSREVAGVAFPSRATLVIRLTAVGAHRGLALNAVLRHEIVHLLLPARLRGRARLPLWFEEGLAQLIGARIDRSDVDGLPIAAAVGALIPLAELTASFPEDRAKRALAYAEGESAVSFFLERHGRRGLFRLFDAMIGSGSFEAALRREFGISPGDLEREWREWLEEEGDPWWLAVLEGAFPLLLLFIASLLVIVAYFRMRRTRRRAYEELPE